MGLTDILFGLLIVSIALAIFCFMMRSVKRQGRINRVWREFAEIKGLTEQPAGEGALLRFQGDIQGMPFALECIATEGTPVRIGKLRMSFGEGPKMFSRMAVRLPGVPRGLRLYRQTSWSRLGRAVGMQDIITGDSEFDRTFMVKGSDPDAVVTFLSPFRRMALLSDAAKLVGLELESGELIVLRRGQIDTGEELDALFSQVASLAADLARSVV